MRPRVSVVLAVYNATWCIQRALDAVMAQTFPAAEIEVLVCDDGSTDGTPEFVEKLYGDRVRVLRLPHKNASATRSVGLAEAKGEWLSFLDADDWWVPQKLESQLRFLEAHPDVKWLSSDGDFVAEEGVLRDSWLADYFAPVTERVGDLFPLLVKRCFPLMSSVLAQRDAYAAVGGINPAITYSHDYDLWLRIAAKYPCAVTTDKLIHYWYHTGSLSRRLEARHRDDLAIMERIARGEFREDAGSRRMGKERAAGLAFDLGLLCLRDGRVPEAREMFARAAVAGTLSRRLFATAGRIVPAPLVPAVLGMRWLKGPVAGSRVKPGTLGGPEGRA
jgi:glycosyltransferase involved in cell wall biosynthesis